MGKKQWKKKGKGDKAQGDRNGGEGQGGGSRDGSDQGDGGCLECKGGGGGECKVEILWEWFVGDAAGKGGMGRRGEGRDCVIVRQGGGGGGGGLCSECKVEEMWGSFVEGSMGRARQGTRGRGSGGDSGRGASLLGMEDVGSRNQVVVVGWTGLVGAMREE